MLRIHCYASKALLFLCLLGGIVCFSLDQSVAEDLNAIVDWPFWQQSDKTQYRYDIAQITEQEIQFTDGKTLKKKQRYSLQGLAKRDANKVHFKVESGTVEALQNTGKIKPGEFTVLIANGKKSQPAEIEPELNLAPIGSLPKECLELYTRWIRTVIAADLSKCFNLEQLLTHKQGANSWTLKPSDVRGWSGTGKLKFGVENPVLELQLSRRLASDRRFNYPGAARIKMKIVVQWNPSDRNIMTITSELSIKTTFTSRTGDEKDGTLNYTVTKKLSRKAAS